MDVDRRERARGALYGLAIGDALGMPTQQMPREFVVRTFGTITGFHAGPPENEISAGFRAGSVTDDTEQAVILAETLLAGDGKVDHTVFAARLRAWEKIASARGGEQLGPSTQRALDALARGVAVEDAGRRGDTNGAAMRIAPVGIAFAAAPLDRLVDAVADASVLTHNTGIAIAGAAAVAAAVSVGVEGGSVADAIASAFDAAEQGTRRGRFGAGARVTRRMHAALELVGRVHADDAFLDELDQFVGTSVATQESVPAVFALVARWPADPWNACCAAAGLGGDSDTIGAMVGAVLGATNGYAAWPVDGVDTVRTVNDLHLDALVDRLLALRAQVGVASMSSASFDHHAPGFQARLAQTYAELRRECPVAHSDQHGGFWVVTRYRDVAVVARDQARFSSNCSVVVPAADVGFLPPLETDSPALDRYRKMLSPFLAPGAVRALEPSIHAFVAAALDAIVDRGHAELVDRGHAELVAEFANPVPAQTTMALLGLDPADWRFFADPLHDASYSLPGSDAFLDAIERIGTFGARIAAEVDARMTSPRDDMISALLADAPDGVRASRDEVIGLVRMAVFGGMDTVMAAMSSAVLRIGRDATLRRALVDDPGLVPAAIEEVLRLDAPIQGFARTVRSDCAVGRQTVTAGEIVFIAWAAANRDDGVFERPDEFVLARQPNRHLTFGIGPHFCQGAALARTEMRIMLTELLRRIPDYAIMEDAVVAPPTIGIANGFVAVPVRFPVVSA